MYTFNNNTAERLTTVCYFERFHSENITKDNIAKHTLLNNAYDWFLKIVKIALFVITLVV